MSPLGDDAVHSKKILLYQKVHCPSCAGTHSLYVTIKQGGPGQVSRVRYQCPASGDIVGVIPRGTRQTKTAIEPDWIECEPLTSEQ